jgi:hypothetical protein
MNTTPITLESLDCTRKIVLVEWRKYPDGWFGYTRVNLESARTSFAGAASYYSNRNYVEVSK